MSQTNCFALGGPGDSVLETTDGSTWTSLTTPFSIAGFDAEYISCPASNTCYVSGTVGSDPEVYVTTNGGSTWTPESISSSTFTGFFSLECPSATTCYGTGVYIASGSPDEFYPAGVVTTNGGTAWTPFWTSSTLPAGYGGTDSETFLTGVACSTPSTCYVTGGSGIVEGTTDSGAGWTQQTLPAGVSEVSSISCPMAGLCLATGIGSNGDSLSLGVTEWGDDDHADGPLAPRSSASRLPTRPL